MLWVWSESSEEMVTANSALKSPTGSVATLTLLCK